MFIARTKADQNRAILDPWSLVHLAVGLAAGLIAAPRGPAIAAAIGYEFVEPHISTATFQASGPEVPANAVADVVLFAVGMELGRRWNQTGA